MVRSGLLLLSVLAPCGCSPIDEAFDRSSMLQVASGFEVEGDMSEDSSAAAALVHALGLDFSDEKDGALLRRDVQTEMDLASERAGEGTLDLEEISKGLTQAMSDELIRLVNAEIEAPFQEQLPVKESPEAWVQKTTEALRRVADHIEKQELKEPLERWAQKSAEASGAVARKLMDKYLDWQHVTSSSLALQGQKTHLSDPDGALVKRNIEQAMHIFSKTTTDDIRQFENISRTVHKAWETEIHRVVNDFSAMTFGKLSEKSLQWAANRHTNYEHRKKQLEEWMHENVRDGMLEWKMLDYLRRQYVTTSTAVDTWMNNTIDWERLAAGEFIQKKQVVKAVTSLDATAIADITADIKVRAEDMLQLQSELLVAEAAAGQRHEASGQSVDGVKKGKLDEVLTSGLKASMDSSALLAQKWFLSTVDLQKLFARFSRLMSQQDHLDGPAEEDFYTAEDSFEKVFKLQMHLVGDKPTEETHVLEDGQLSPQSIERIDSIIDKSAGMARQWLAKNVELQSVAEDALRAMSKP